MRIYTIDTKNRKERPKRAYILKYYIPDDFRSMGNPYFSYGYPASLFDAPCYNLGNCDELTWKAFTYLVDMPTRMNKNQLEYITGFSWGYTENKNGCTGLLDFERLTEEHFAKHKQFINDQYPKFTV